MSDERARELEERGIAAAKAGRKDEARTLLQHSLRIDSTSDNAWLWLASVARDKRERLLCLQKVLEINPDNEMGLRAVRAMGIDPYQLVPQRATIDQSLVDVDELVEEPRIPLPPLEDLEEIQSLAEEIAQDYLESPADNITWERKAKGRAGDREIWVLRGQIGAAVGTFAAILLGLAVIVVSNSPQLQLTLFGASETPRPPTATRTPTPTAIPPTQPATFTPTPQQTPTSSPTPNAGVIPWPVDNAGINVFLTPTPTQLHQNAGDDNAIATAIFALQRNENIDDAISRMQFNQRETENTFTAFPYYFEALLLLKQDNPEAALIRLDIAQERLDRTEGLGVLGESEIRNATPILNLGYAKVYQYQATQMIELGRVGEAENLVNQIETLIEEAILIDPFYPDLFVTLAESYMLVDRYGDAINVLSPNTLQPDLLSDVSVIVTRGHAYLRAGYAAETRSDAGGARENFARAEYEGFLGIYVNPFNEAAHQLRIEAAFAMGDEALATIYTRRYDIQDDFVSYLTYFPNSAEAYRQLANSWILEGKPDFALQSFSEALNAQGSNEVLADVRVSRAGLYADLQRYDLALADLNEAVSLNDTLSTRFLRMQIAYAAGDFDTALADGNFLTEAEYPEVATIDFIRARILIDRAEDVADFTQGLELLNGILQLLPADQQAIANEYRARAYLEREELGDALLAINNSLEGGETGTRYYLRALIYDTQGDRDNALQDYEWLITWDAVYSYAFMSDVIERYDTIISSISQEQADAMATSVAATQEAVNATATVSVAETATSLAATQEAIGTFTPTPTPEAEVTPEVTPEVTIEVTAQSAPTAEPTPTREG